MADYVTEQSGTGIVHIAPAYGEDDYKTVQQHGLSFVNVVDLKGCYTEAVPELVGRFVRTVMSTSLKCLQQKSFYLLKKNMSIATHIAGAVIHHYCTMQQIAGLSKCRQ